MEFHAACFLRFSDSIGFQALSIVVVDLYQSTILLTSSRRKLITWLAESLPIVTP